MKGYVLFLVAIITLLVSIDAASVTTNKLQDSRTEAAVRRFRFLREEPNTVDTIATNDEERAGITGVLKKLLSGTKNKLKDKKLAIKLHLDASLMNLDKPVQKRVAQGIDPDQVYTTFKLHKSSNTDAGLYMTAEFLFWKKLTAEWMKKYPNWVSKIPKQ